MKCTSNCYSNYIGQHSLKKLNTPTERRVLKVKQNASLAWHSLSLTKAVENPLTPSNGKKTSTKTTPTTITMKAPHVEISPLWKIDLRYPDSCVSRMNLRFLHSNGRRVNYRRQENRIEIHLVKFIVLLSSHWHHWKEFPASADYHKTAYKGFSKVIYMLW